MPWWTTVIGNWDNSEREGNSHCFCREMRWWSVKWGVWLTSGRRVSECGIMGRRERGREVASIEISNGFWMGRRWEADREKIAEQSSCQNFLTQVFLNFIHAIFFIRNTVEFQLVLFLKFLQNWTSFVAYLLLIFLMILHSLLLKKLL